MITLYELHWSHYCEKIRWALDFKNISWKKVNINPFTKEEFSQHLGTNKPFVPFIYDESTKLGIGDSSPILDYLEAHYPKHPLFPSDFDKKDNFYQLLLELDSKLGIVGRKLGYTQLILEKPSILSTLFIPNLWKGFFNLPILRNISGAILGMLLIKRFRLEKTEDLNLYEELEKYLLTFSIYFKKNNFLFENKFSAADITLAVYLRPLRIIPFFKDNLDLQILFQWQEKLLEQHEREYELLYEKMIKNHRKKHSAVTRKASTIPVKLNYFEKISIACNNNKSAYNDQEKIWTWRVIFIPYYYFFKIWKNKMRKQ